MAGAPEVAAQTPLVTTTSCWEGTCHVCGRDYAEGEAVTKMAQGDWLPFACWEKHYKRLDVSPPKPSERRASARTLLASRSSH